MEEYDLLSRFNPDEHLRIRNPRLRLAMRMIWYCMVASSIGGCLFTLSFLLDFPDSLAEDLQQALILAIFFGGGTALHQRLLASILIGAAMAFVTGRFPHPIAYVWSYHLATGIAAATIVHLFAPIQPARFYLTELTAGDFDTRLEVAAAFAIYAGAIYLSQVVARKYIRETAA